MGVVFPHFKLRPVACRSCQLPGVATRTAGDPVAQPASLGNPINVHITRQTAIV
ncbi:hypothetical protein BaRGS_00030605, partial [Batillaria attramentaria]